MTIGDVTAGLAQTGGLLVIPLIVLLIFTLVYYFRSSDATDASTRRQAARQQKTFGTLSAVLGGVIVSLWIVSIWIGVVG